MQFKLDRDSQTSEALAFSASQLSPENTLRELSGANAALAAGAWARDWEPPGILQAYRSKLGYLLVKRLLDVTLSLMAIILLSPLLLVLCLAIRLDSRGPILFKQERPGFGGRPFLCWKFRTMAIDAEQILAGRPDLQEEFALYGKIKDDPRITKMGVFLRKTSLDELPQLFNILVGQMSIVGPRPIVWSQVEQYGKNIDKLYSVLPGLAGLWQVQGRSNTTMDERIEMDLTYAEQASLAMDTKLALQTAISVIKKDGAY